MENSNTNRISRVHRIKCHPPYFGEVRAGNKSFEVRKNDRDYCEGDFLVLSEYDPTGGGYTGQICYREITYVLDGGDFGVDSDHVVMAIRHLPCLHK